MSTTPIEKFQLNQFSNNFPHTRLRRLRQQAALRNLIRETELTPNDLVLPLFIKHGDNEKKAISAMPGHYQLGLADLAQEIKEIVNLNIPAVVLFGLPEKKDAHGSDSYHPHGIIQNAIQEIKSLAPDLLVIADTCFCEYTDHGHCGVMNNDTGTLDLDNDRTLTLLTQQAISQAQAGADVIAPSGMVDGMIAAIRQGLDAEGFTHIPILSYAIKYASALYGPFREAADGAPQFGDRRSYQMDPANSNEALREASLDIQEGADMLMVKPAASYLDIIYKVKQAYPELPLSAYHTSGEYAMIKAASANGWLDERKTALETLTAIKRAGADFIINYYCKEVVRWLE